MLSSLSRLSAGRGYLTFCRSGQDVILQAHLNEPYVFSYLQSRASEARPWMSEIEELPWINDDRTSRTVLLASFSYLQFHEIRAAIFNSLKLNETFWIIVRRKTQEEQYVI